MIKRLVKNTLFLHNPLARFLLDFYKLCKIRKAKVIFVSYRLHDKSQRLRGWNKPMTWLAEFDDTGHIGVFDANHFKHFGLFKFFIKSDTKIVINSLLSFKYDNIEKIYQLNLPLWVYLHETKWVFDEFKKNHSQIFERVIKRLKQSRILCVSKQQEVFLKNDYGISRTLLIGNCIDKSFCFSQKKKEENSANIVMIGSLRARKGVDLFSEVADQFDHDSNYQFSWIGPRDSNDSIYQSSNVNYLGPVQPKDMEEVYEMADILFLSSKDDPQPLVCLEAIASGLKLVIYREVGTSELLGVERVASIFQEYNVESASASIREARSKVITERDFKEIFDSYCSIASFKKRVFRALEAKI